MHQRQRQAHDNFVFDQCDNVESFFRQNGVQFVIGLYRCFQLVLAGEQGNHTPCFQFERHRRQATLTFNAERGRQTVTQRGSQQTVLKTFHLEFHHASIGCQQLMYALGERRNRPFVLQRSAIAGKRERINQNRVRHKPGMILSAPSLCQNKPAY
ncbi:hypothetical protein D3C78_1389940 [compost metagenome]